MSHAARRACITVVLLGSVSAFATPLFAAAATAAAPPFTVQTNPYTFDHAPSWSPDNRTVVFHHDVPGVGMQVFTAYLDGSHLKCITCGQPGPNMVPTFRPQGDKILFHSWRGHNITFGGPGFGGLGSTFWVVNPDGTNPVELTPAELGAEGMDNFHAYFSPDGRHIAWAHIDWNFVTPITQAMPGKGTGKWSIYLADYVEGPIPHLANVRQVRPENGHFYETQWWAPDNSGFLFTESSDAAVDLDLYFYNLATGAITRLTSNHTWTEQAIFTPDGKHVIYMSIKDHQGSWAAWSAVSNALSIPTAYDYALLLPLFYGIFLTPAVPPACDLYEIDLATGQQRQITQDGADGWIIPELAYAPDGKRLMWTELKIQDGLRLDQDPSRQPGDELSLLSNPPTLPGPSALDHGSEVFYVVQRTRIGTFADAASGVSALGSIGATALPSTSTTQPMSRAVGAWLELGMLAAAAGLLAGLRRRPRHRRPRLVD